MSVNDNKEETKMLSMVDVKQNRGCPNKTIRESWEGLSTDEKPILKENRNGSEFYEMDTTEFFKWDGENLVWLQQ
jgi:hypothetical protein